MEIKVYDTLSAMRAVLAQPVDERKAAYQKYMLEPLRDYWEPLLARFAPHMANNEDAAMKMVWDVDLQADAGETLAALDRLEQADAWSRAYDALCAAARAFEAAGRPTLMDELTGIVTLGNPRDKLFMELNRGYAGAQCPGYAVVVIWPNSYNVPRIPSAFVHEFHHLVRLAHEPWTLETSVGQYMILEGLAESFAKALYGEEFVGPWVTGLSAEETEQARTIIGRDIKVTGFDKIRSYIFGDQLTIQGGRTPVGLAHCAGYTIGYQVVQTYLNRTGKTIVEATFTPFAEIIEQSGFFAGALPA